MHPVQNLLTVETIQFANFPRRISSRLYIYGGFPKTKKSIATTTADSFPIEIRSHTAHLTYQRTEISLTETGKDYH